MIPIELTKKFSEVRYPMNTGSEEWQDLKIDYELIDDSVAGTVSFYDRSVVDKQKIIQLEKELMEFKNRIDAYTPLDQVENREKENIREKIEIGLEIYKTILESLICP